MTTKFSVNIVIDTKSEEYCENCRFIMRTHGSIKSTYCLLFERNLLGLEKRCGECMKAQYDSERNLWKNKEL